MAASARAGAMTVSQASWPPPSPHWPRGEERADWSAEVWPRAALHAPPAVRSQGEQTVNSQNHKESIVPKQLHVFSVCLCGQ